MDASHSYGSAAALFMIADCHHVFSVRKNSDLPALKAPKSQNSLGAVYETISVTLPIKGCSAKKRWTYVPRILLLDVPRISGEGAYPIPPLSWGPRIDGSR